MRIEHKNGEGFDEWKKDTKLVHQKTVNEAMHLQKGKSQKKNTKRKPGLAKKRLAGGMGRGYKK